MLGVGVILLKLILSELFGRTSLDMTCLVKTCFVTT